MLLNKLVVVRAMDFYNIVFSQLLELIPRQEFETLANQYYAGCQLLKMTHWSVFASMALFPLSVCTGLRDVVDNLSARTAKLYQLGIATVGRSSLARANVKKSCPICEELLAKLLSRCHGLAPRQCVQFNNKLNSIDASPIDLYLCVFPWGKLRSTKGYVKLHVGHGT